MHAFLDTQVELALEASVAVGEFGLVADLPTITAPADAGTEV
jgi:hypothetical protein